MGTHTFLSMKVVAALLVLLAMAAASPTQILRRKSAAQPQDFALLAQEVSEPAAESSEDFEIQCATSCKFVPRAAPGASFLETSAQNKLKIDPKAECHKVCMQPKVADEFKWKINGQVRNCATMCGTVTKLLVQRLGNYVQ